jgi:DNA polymerase I-like protein with 3'-5' exonuclease and polymerase domains
VKQSYPELRDIAKTIQFLTLYGGGAWNLAQKIRISPERARKIYEQVNACTEPAEALAQQLSMEVSKAQKALRARDPVQAIRDSFTKTSDEAQEILDNYFARYAGVAMYIERTKAYIRDNGYSQSLFGRKRRVPEVSAEDEKARERAIRQGVNATIQSAASDGLMLSACLLQERIEAENIDWLRPMGPVHDAIYCMVRTDKLLEGRDLLLECMSRFPTSEDLGIDIPSAPIPMVGDAEHGDNWAAFSEEFGTGLTDDEDDNEKEAA